MTNDELATLLAAQPPGALVVVQMDPKIPIGAEVESVIVETSVAKLPLCVLRLRVEFIPVVETGAETMQ
jgi:hypothetical protein